MVTIVGTNDVPVIAGASSATLVEDSAGPSLSAAGALTIADADAGQSVFAAQASTGSYGSFTLAADGSWTYSADNSQPAIQQLGAGQQITETFTAVSSDGTASQNIAITITGTNDVPVMAGASNATLVEDSAGPGLSAAGALTIADVDAGQSSFAAQASTGSYGSFTLAADGSWTYNANNAQPAIQQLAAGQQLTDTFTAVSSDGTASQNIVITITGSNDVPVIAGASSATLVEDSAGANLSAAGALTIADADAGEAVFAAQASAGSYGNFTLAAGGSWTYNANNAQPAIQQLAAGQQLTDTFTAVSSDGTASQNIVITITGTNDVPVIAGTSSATLVEDSAGPSLSATGALTIADADAGQSVFAVQASAGSYGNFTLAADGSWTYSADNAQPAIQQLAAGQQLTDTFTALSSDGTAAQNIVITITGTNDPLIIIGTATTATASVTEIADEDKGENSTTHMSGGIIAFTDPSGANDHSASVTADASDYLGSMSMESVDQAGNTAGWTFSVANSALDFLAGGETRVQHYTVTLADGRGSTATQTVDITLTGTNDVPVIAGASSATMVEDSASPSLSATGVLTIADADAGQSSFAAQTSIGAYGSIILAADGSWTYSADNSQPAIQQLGAGQQITETFTAVSSDGTASQNIVVTITGTNDVPVISGASNATLVEDSSGTSLNATGALTIADADAGQSSFAVQASTGSYGSFTLAANGNWTYSADNSQPVIQQLGAGQTLTETFNAVSSDGTASQNIVITITGSNDVPVIVGASSATLVEDSAGANLSAAGALTIADADAGQSSFAAQASTGSYGSFTLAADGSWTYSADNAQPAIQQLDDGQQITETFTAVSSDGTAAQNIVITITGANDALAIIGTATTATASVSEIADGAAGENAITHARTGIIAFADPSGTNDHSASVAADASDYLGSMSMESVDQAGNTAGWTFSVANSALDFLAAGETRVQHYTVTLADGQGSTATQAVDITLTGSNDAPVANDDSAFVLPNSSVNVNVLANDNDVDSTLFNVSGVGAAANGVAVLNADGTITYTPTAGYTGTDSFNYTVTDAYGASDVGTVSVGVGYFDHDQTALDMFLQGNYVEIGVSLLGTLGSLSDPPPNYHPRVKFDGIHFDTLSCVVDLDGWDTGDAPLTGDFFSDYDTIVYAFNGQNHVQDKFSSGYNSSIPTDLSTASILRALTTAVVDEALSIQQRIELDPSATYFKTTITLQNVSADTLNDVRVMRGFFAQQDLPTYDSYYTFNDVLSNPTSGNDLAIVQALGRYSGVSVNLVAFDSAARASTFGDYYRTNAYDPFAWDTPLDLNGQLNDQAGSTNTNITLNTKFGDLAAGQSITKEYYISFNGHGNGNDMCIGTEGADNINAGAGNDILLGLTGNDILTGGAGNDRFVFTHGAGADTITDFVAGAGTDDVIELRDMGVTSFTEVMSHATQSGTDVVLDLSFGDQITLNNVTVAQLHADDFMFA